MTTQRMAEREINSAMIGRELFEAKNLSVD